MSWDEESWKEAAREYHARQPPTKIPTECPPPLIGVCPICRCDPCQTPGYCGYCRLDEAVRATVKRSPREARRRELMLNPAASLELLYNFVAKPPGSGAPEATVEALMIALRRGLVALDDSSNQRRLAMLDQRQLKQVMERLLNPGSKSGRKAWSADDVRVLLKKHRGMK